MTEYDPEERTAFGYVTGLAADEWGYISIDELADLTFHGVPMIEIDAHFEPNNAAKVFMLTNNMAALASLP